MVIDSVFGTFATFEDLDRHLELVPPPGLLDWLAWMVWPTRRQLILFEARRERKERGIRFDRAAYYGGGEDVRRRP